MRSEHKESINILIMEDLKKVKGQKLKIVKSKSGIHEEAPSILGDSNPK